MIPEVLFSSYQRYKEDTSVFATWLAQAARACGFEVMSPERNDVEVHLPSSALEAKASRLKGEARKQAKAAASTDRSLRQKGEDESAPISKYMIKTRELIEQAEAVVASGNNRLQMPDKIVRVARRAIETRQRCSRWFRETESKEIDSTKKHAYFTAVLEQALGILKPCYSNNTRNSVQLPDPKKPDQRTTQARPETFEDDLTNRFQLLQVEDIDDDVEFTAPEVSVPLKHTQFKAQGKPRAESEVWELDDEANADLAFIAFCFFEDLHRIQEFLKTTWKEYKAGELDLMTCAMTSNLAFDLVRRAEEDIINKAPSLLHKPRSYKAISTLIFSAESFTQGEDPGEKIGSDKPLRITPFDEFIYLSTARILIKFEQMSALKMGQFTLPSSVRMSYMFRPDLLELPQVKKWEEEDEFLSQLLLDMRLNNSVSETMARFRRHREAPIEDELTRGLYKLLGEGEVSTWIVFASRVLLDIRDVMGNDISRSHREQVVAGCAAFNALNVIVVGNTPESTGERSKERDVEHIFSLRSLLQYWVIMDPFPLFKKEWLAEWTHIFDSHEALGEISPENLEIWKEQLQSKGDQATTESPSDTAGEQKYRPIKHATEPNFLRTHNPLASGTLMINMRLDMEHVGTILANHYQAIFAVAHLYNATRQREILKASWPEMEELIQIQMNELFARQLPQTSRDLYTCFALRLGISAQHFARNQRKGHVRFWRARHKDGPQMSGSQTSRILQDYVSRKESLARSLHRLGTLIGESEYDLQKADKRVARRQPTPIEALRQVRDWLHNTIPVMSLNYLKLTQTCHNLLKEIHAVIWDELGLLHPLMNNGNPPEYGFCVMTHNVLHELQEIQEIQGDVLGSRETHIAKRARQLDICAKILRKHLDGVGS